MLGWGDHCCALFWVSRVPHALFPLSVFRIDHRPDGGIHAMCLLLRIGGQMIVQVYGLNLTAAADL